MLLVEAEPVGVSGGVITATHQNQGTVKRFSQSGHEQLITNTIASVVGTPLKVQLVTGEASAPKPTASQASTKAAAPEPTDFDVADSTDAEDLGGIELLKAELGGVTITEFDDAGN